MTPEITITPPMMWNWLISSPSQVEANTIAITGIKFMNIALESAPMVSIAFTHIQGAKIEAATAA